MTLTAGTNGGYMSEGGPNWAAGTAGQSALTFPAPSVPAPASQRRAPTRGWYGLAGILAVVGVLALASAVSSIVGFGGVVAGFDRVDVPGQAELPLDAGEYVVYFEAPGGGGMPPLDLRIDAGDGAAPVELRRPAGSFEYQVGGYDGSAVWEFTVTDPGTHRFEVTSSERFGQLAIGTSMAGGLLRTVLGVLGGVGALFVAALVAVITAVRRSRHRRQAMASPAPNSWGTPPPAGW